MDNYTLVRQLVEMDKELTLLADKWCAILGMETLHYNVLANWLNMTMIQMGNDAAEQVKSV